jgi:hypothetical protein
MKIKHVYLMAAMLGLALILAGCAGSPPIALQSAPPYEPALSAIATLSDSSNPADMAASVVKTHLALYVRTAAKKLRKGEIDSEYARFVRTEAEELHTLLSTALARRDLIAIRDISDRIDMAKINLEVRNAKKY